jgi:hypothetical protein
MDLPLVTLLKDDYEKRKKIYESKELFFELSNNRVHVEPNEELQSLSAAITKGTELLTSELDAHKQLRIKSKCLDESEHFVKNVCIEIKQKIPHVEQYFNKLDSSVKDKLENIMTCLDEIMDDVKAIVALKKNELEDQIEKNNALLASMADIYGILKHTNIGHVCPICLQNEVNTFCNPCGHCFCSKCMTHTYCYICRTRINKMQPLYFS